ncbi:ABC-type transport auxiliary lipoprotein family protein [Salidesulfovibrio onnuriiensis]|uniref:ABC-type transport auxiliary lipoprotein family protein n=1 Tax=Salidesulfovibrio onnuriiensis TaxID=2583823 RepID=UPI0011C7D53D|nr:ABC-type transport auxiliary lipoprotein family protein [Salidesulfovibrio onnuriiensis]
MKTVHRILFVLVTLSLLAGCGGLSRKAVEKRYYTLDVQRERAEAAPVSEKLLKVRRMQISPLYDGRELVYKLDNGRMESDFYNLFFMPPVELLSHDLDRWMDGAGLFAGSVSPASLAEADYTLEGVVNVLYGDFSGGRESALVEMQFFLIDERSAENHIVFSRNYSVRTPVSGNSPASVVQGMREGARAVFTSLESDLRTFLAGKL